MNYNNNSNKRRPKKSSNKGGSSLTNKNQVRQMIESLRSKATKRYILTSTGTVTTQASITSGGTLFPCDQIAQGTGNQARLGMDARVRNISYKATLDPDSTDVFDTFRVIIFRWSDYAAATVPDVLVSTTNLVNSFYDLENIKTQKLQILFDQNYNTAVGKGSSNVDVNINCDYPIVWNSTSASSAVVGSIYVLLCSDSTAIPSPEASGAMSIRIEQD